MFRVTKHDFTFTSIRIAFKKCAFLPNVLHCDLRIPRLKQNPNKL